MRPGAGGLLRSAHAQVTVAALQTALTDDVATNVARVTELVREAAGEGRADHPAERAVRGPLLLPHAARGRLRARAPRRGPPDAAPLPAARRRARRRDPGVVLRAGRPRALQLGRGVRRRRRATSASTARATSPTGPGYQEKFFFKPGNTGFRAFATRFGTIGVAICWDQWFPEAARAMTLAGADVLFYPTAIGVGARGARARQPRLVAARDDRPRGRERGRAWSPRTGSAARATGARRDHVLRQLVRRATRAATSSPSSAATSRASRSPRSTSRSSAASARAWASSAIAARRCTARSSSERACERTEVRQSSADATTCQRSVTEHETFCFYELMAPAIQERYASRRALRICPGRPRARRADRCARALGAAGLAQLLHRARRRSSGSRIPMSADGRPATSTRSGWASR